MQVNILGTTYEMEKTEGFMDAFEWQINQALEENGLYLNHLVIDGTPVADDYESYITEHFDRIQYIEVRADTLADMLENALHSGRDYLERALPEIRKLGRAFHHQPDSTTWAKFEQMMEGLDWVLLMMRSMAANADTLAGGEEYGYLALLLGTKLAYLTSAVTRRDPVSSGDLIVYEIMPLLESVARRVDQTICDPGPLRTTG